MRSWLLKVFRRNQFLTPEQDSFNVYLNKARVVVEQAFGRLKSRWRILYKKIDLEVNFVPSVVVACCTLHNIIEHVHNSFNDDWMQEYKDHLQTSERGNLQHDPDESDENFNLEDEDEEIEAQHRNQAEIIREALKLHVQQFPILRSQHQRV